MTLSIPEKPKVNAKHYAETLLPSFIEVCKSLLPSRLIFQQDGALLIRQCWFKTGLPPTAVNLLAKMNGHQTHQTLTLLTITLHYITLH